MSKRHDQTRSEESRATILMVDDEPQNAQTLRDLLEYHGFRVETAENGIQALDRLTSGHRFGLVITDMKTPEMEGLELLRQVQRLRKNLPVIVLTAYATLKNGLQAIKEGVYDYISKPFTVHLLMDVIHEALRSEL